MPRSVHELPRALLLDLDDTILDDTGSVDACWQAACDAFAGQTGLEAGRLHQAIDVTRAWYWDDPERHRIGREDLRAASAYIVELALQSFSITDTGLARAIAESYRDQRDDFICLFPGATETLEALRERRISLALLTNGSAAAQRGKVERFGLASYFDCILIEGEQGFGKPDERVYRSALKALGASPDDAWCVGDNIEWDVGAPQALGIGGVWVSRTQTQPPDRCRSVTPDLVITALPELLR